MNITEPQKYNVYNRIVKEFFTFDVNQKIRGLYYDSIPMNYRSMNWEITLKIIDLI